MNVLVVVNGAVHGKDTTYNAIRLAAAVPE